MQRHFVSYPKSGRSWLRYILAQLGAEKPIHFHHDGFEFNDGSRPPHDFSLPARMQHYAGIEKLVYLQRDPRDVMVSLYFQVTGRFRDFFGYTGTPSQFIRDCYFGAENLQRFREMWRQIAQRRDLLSISYEECHADLHGTTQRVLRYYGFDVAEGTIEAAIENASFERMQQLEQSGLYPEPWLRPRNDSAKVRNGKVGGFRTMLSAADIEYLNTVFGLE